MLKLKSLSIITLITLFCLFTTACHNDKDNTHLVKIGTISGPETKLMEVAKEVAAKRYGLDIEIYPFTDYNMPNEALADGSIDANMYQTVAYLNAAMKAKGYDFAVIGKTFIYPMGIYSHKFKKLADLPQQAVVAIANDPNNEARGLLLLQQAGIIKLKSGVNVAATPLDIIDNPKQLQIKPLDAAQLPRVLPDVDIAPINTNYAVTAGLLPSRDALFLEGANSTYYVNVVVVRKADISKLKYKALMEALHSPEVLTKAKELFAGQAVPGWLSNE